ncbi:MAG TPA: hypothetical protein VGC79_06670 [Polyangiaceae bacterium]
MGRNIEQTLADLSISSPHEVPDGKISATWWRRVVKWPPDVFAVTSTLLGESGAYRLAVSPPSGKRWPPRRQWNEEVDAQAEAWWRWVAAGSLVPTPSWLLAIGSVVRAAVKTPIFELADNWKLVCALLELHAIADEACGGFGMPAPTDEDGRDNEWKVYRLGANDLLARSDSLSHFSKHSIRVLPKMRTPQAGISLRSLSGHLAVTRFAEVDVKWAHAPQFSDKKSSFNLLLLPVPLEVSPANFRPVPGALDNMDTKRFGFFRFEPVALDEGYVRRLLEAAARCAGGVDGVIFPESALSEAELAAVKRLVEEAFNGERLPFLLAGVRGTRENIAHFSIFVRGTWHDYPQSKHHRWALDRGQILNYKIGAALHPSIRWWEDIDVRRRELRFILVNSWLGICPLICEDLARQDPVGQIIRALGPTLVIALLLDGPQLNGRWPARYATVLADDPGSSVLTFTPLGMSERSVPAGASPKRVIGLWKDPRTGAQELHLEAGRTALLLTLCNEWSQEWMADGRSDSGSAAQLYLGHVEQLS